MNGQDAFDRVLEALVEKTREHAVLHAEKDALRMSAREAETALRAERESIAAERHRMRTAAAKAEGAATRLTELRSAASEVHNLLLGLEIPEAKKSLQRLLNAYEATAQDDEIPF